LSDEDLRRLNAILPWAAFIVDGKGRRFGDSYSTTKRSTAQELPDRRIVAFNEQVPLVGRRVLEVGCFEGIHTAALCWLGAEVVAIDSRIENVVKTAVRCAVLGYWADVRCLDLEQSDSATFDCEFDVLHHVGVLYHLTDPVDHLVRVAAQVNEAILLDTHVAPKGAPMETYESQGDLWSYRRFHESGRSTPFAGMRDHSKWLSESDLIRLLEHCGFARVHVVERRAERNGPRILVHAFRE
jgi:tRNA (mo5U34)-methyltransferase